MARITNQLTLLEGASFQSPIDTGFISRWRAILDAIGTFQNCVVAHSDYAVTCSRGCDNCCCHWVEDVNSFEITIIADRLRKNYPDRIADIRRQCKSDGEELERLDRLVQDRLREAAGEDPSAEPAIDQVDLLLQVFYRMRRPCPLLDSEGGCMVYDQRPLTCRMYVSFSDPIRCDPEYITPATTSTCLIDLSERANAIIDRLHFTYLRHKGDTGLRSQLARYLA